MPTKILVNSDLGEALGIRTFGNDEALMPVIDLANVACGFHSGDPDAMAATVASAVAHGVRIGAHPGLPDVVGFGRRAMALTPAELRHLLVYQVGALAGFAALADASLYHLKPHGALYSMLAQDEALMTETARVAKDFGLVVLGTPGTLHQSVCERTGVEFVGELYVDLDYDDDGRVVVRRQPGPRSLDDVRTRVRTALDEGVVVSVNDRRIPVDFGSVCVHSDSREAPDVAETVVATLREAGRLS